ncbi:NAD(P)-binding protein [Atractiella rhizophila]|nr:NAD(P)-binding protein [Atractiella rhizophila]
MGLLPFPWTEFWPGTPVWPDAIPNQKGKVFLVTGGNSGVGYVTVKARFSSWARKSALIKKQKLLLNEATVYLAARNSEKTTKALQKLVEDTGKSKELRFLDLDLSDLNKVKTAAEEFKNCETSWSSGIFRPPLSEFTAQGYDMTLGTNVVALHLFTTLLLPVLRAAKESRIVNLSSIQHHLSHPDIIDYDTFRDGEKRNKLGPPGLYSQSKSAVILLSYAMNRRLKADNITVIPVDPGGIRTDGLRHISWFERFVIRLLTFDCDQAGYNAFYAATLPGLDGKNEIHIVPWMKISTPRRDHLNTKKQDELVIWLDKEVDAYL